MMPVAGDVPTGAKYALLMVASAYSLATVMLVSWTASPPYSNKVKLQFIF